MVEFVWFGFLALFFGLLILDLSILHRESATLSVRQALFWTAVWVSVAMSFTGVIYGLYEYRWLGFVPGHGVRDGADAVVPFEETDEASCGLAGSSASTWSATNA